MHAHTHALYTPLGVRWENENKKPQNKTTLLGSISSIAETN